MTAVDANDIEWQPLRNVADTKDGHPPFMTWRAKVNGGFLYATVLRDEEPKSKARHGRNAELSDFIGGVRGAVSVVFVPDVRR